MSHQLLNSTRLMLASAREEKMAKMDGSSCPSTQHRWFYRPLNKPAASTSEERLANGGWAGWGGGGGMGSEGGGSEPTSVPAGHGSHHETAALSLPALPWT